MLIAGAALCVCLAAAAAMLAFNRFSDATNEYEGVKLGSSRDEVACRLGPPTMFLEPAPKSWPKINGADAYQFVAAYRAYNVGVPAWASNTGAEVKSDLPPGKSVNDYDKGSWNIPNVGRASSKPPSPRSTGSPPKPPPHAAFWTAWTRRSWRRPSGANWSPRTLPTNRPRSCWIASAPSEPSRRSPSGAVGPPALKALHDDPRLPDRHVAAAAPRRRG